MRSGAVRRDRRRRGACGLGHGDPARARGARVLLADRARFPRDKPCGGGVTGRAVRELPCAIDPVVEDVVRSLEVRLRYRKRFEGRSESRSS